MKAKLILISMLIGAVLATGAYYSIVRSRATQQRIDTSRAAVVTRMQSLGRLETSQFTIEKIITADKGSSSDLSSFFFGDKLLLVAHGEVVAGFDLAAITPEDIQVEGSTLKVTLPAPQILYSRLDNEQTKVFDRKLGLLARPDKDLEADARAAAEKSIRTAACDSEILRKASENASTQLKALFSAMDFTEVTVAIPALPPCS